VTEGAVEEVTGWLRLPSWREALRFSASPFAITIDLASHIEMALEP
jgi:hypothetical protein